MEVLDINQIHKRLLEIAIVVDGICERHGIPFYMISGTMLGAIRHKGFIPWDDDMDFAVPYEYYDDLVKILNKELPSNMQCLSYALSKTYMTPWLKVEDLDTMVMDHSLDLPKDQMPGLTIDIFPLVSCEKGECNPTIVKIQRLLSVLRFAYGLAPGAKFSLRNIVKRLSRLFIPLSATSINVRIKELMNSITPGNYYIIPVDPNYHSRFFPARWFAPLVKYTFENYSFLGAAEYEQYLTAVYSNYMQLPPESKRRIHCDNVSTRR